LGADLLSIGRSSLSTSKKSLATTGHNIANANTEGYSRQEVRTKTGTPIAEGQHVFGSGVTIQSVKRAHDDLAEKKLNLSLTSHAHNEEKMHQLGQVEEIFNEVNSEGLNKILNRFFNSMRELANQPENESIRAIVRDNANIVVKDFHRVRDSLTMVSQSIDNKIENSVTDINSLLNSVANLNKEITRLEVAGGETGDLRDQRDNSVRELAKFIKINSYADEKNQYVISAEGIGSLVAGGVVSELKAMRVLPPGADNSENGNIEIFFKDRSSSDNSLSPNILTGKLGADFVTRNETIKELTTNLDQLAHGLANATNAIHRKGYINREIQFDEMGQPINPKGVDKITGVNFFKAPTAIHRASEYLQLSDEVKSDLNNIATGLEPNKPGDNRIAIGIAKLQHEKILGEGSSTLEEQYLKSIGKIGLLSAKSKVETEQSSGILAQAKSIKERISGVSLDEETANMVRYQHAYEASARIIKASDEMFRAVLAMMN
jgi:flagellar hook-associated protein 1 FlgK